MYIYICLNFFPGYIFHPSSKLKRAMASPAACVVTMGLLVLLCFSLCSAHRLLLDSPARIHTHEGSSRNAGGPKVPFEGLLFHSIPILPESPSSTSDGIPFAGEPVPPPHNLSPHHQEQTIFKNSKENPPRIRWVETDLEGGLLPLNNPTHHHEGQEQNIVMNSEEYPPEIHHHGHHQGVTEKMLTQNAHSHEANTDPA